MHPFEVFIEEGKIPAIVLRHPSPDGSVIGSFPIKDIAPDLLLLAPEERSDFYTCKVAACLLWKKQGGILWIDFKPNMPPTLEFVKITPG